MAQPDLVVLTVFMKADIAEVTRVLHVLVRQKVQIEQFSANVVQRDTVKIKRIHTVTEPGIRVMVVATTESRSEVERATKALNRLVSVFKVVVDAC